MFRELSERDVFRELTLLSLILFVCLRGSCLCQMPVLYKGWESAGQPQPLRATGGQIQWWQGCLSGGYQKGTAHSRVYVKVMRDRLTDWNMKVCIITLQVLQMQQWNKRHYCAGHKTVSVTARFTNLNSNSSLFSFFFAKVLVSIEFCFVLK